MALLNYVKTALVILLFYISIMNATLREILLYRSHIALIPMWSTLESACDQAWDCLHLIKLDNGTRTEIALYKPIPVHPQPVRPAAVVQTERFSQTSELLVYRHVSQVSDIQYWCPRTRITSAMFPCGTLGQFVFDLELIWRACFCRDICQLLWFLPSQRHFNLLFIITFVINIYKVYCLLLCHIYFFCDLELDLKVKCLCSQHAIVVSVSVEANGSE